MDGIDEIRGLQIENIKVVADLDTFLVEIGTKGPSAKNNGIVNLIGKFLFPHLDTLPGSPTAGIEQKND
jgi:hypothetical protein